MINFVSTKLCVKILDLVEKCGRPVNFVPVVEYLERKQIGLSRIKDIFL